MNEIETILTKLLKCDRSQLYLDKDRLTLGARRFNRLEQILKKRLSGQPLQYLIGEVEFMGLKLKVKPGVLIPRPETEILVENAIVRISASQEMTPRILDLGTGSGNIAIALAKFLKGIQIYAVDISDLCLSVARTNARLNGVWNKITFVRSDLFSCFKGKNEMFDFLVSNPPYIAPHQYERLPDDVRHEPSLALLAKEEGLYFYSRIEEGARTSLKARGVIFLEIGDGQALDVRKIFKGSSLWKEVKFIKDYHGIERVAIIKKQRRTLSKVEVL